MIWVIESTLRDRHTEPDWFENIVVGDYLSRVNAEKYCPPPNNFRDIVFYTPKDRRILVKHWWFEVPQDYRVSSADFDYMPLAYDGDYEAWEKTMSWFLDLPGDHRELWAVEEENRELL